MKKEIADNNMQHFPITDLFRVCAGYECVRLCSIASCLAICSPCFYATYTVLHKRDITFAAHRHNVNMLLSNNNFFCCFSRVQAVWLSHTVFKELSFVHLYLLLYLIINFRSQH